ncbi:MAG: alpha/beta hydrolase, partial [Microbacterium sp.]
DPQAMGGRLVAYDKPGQGRSYAPGMDARAVGLPGLVRHLEALVRDVGGPVVLMGHSRGALPVTALALRRPELVAGLVLVSSNTLAPPSDVTPADFYVRAYADPPEHPDDEYVRRELTMNSFDAGHVDDGILDARRRAAVESGWWADRAHRMQVYPAVSASLQRGRDEVLGRLSADGLRMPVLLLWGHDDVSAPPQLGDRLRDLLMASTRDVTAVQVNRSGHYVYREHPGEFMALTRAFRNTLDTANES